MMQALSSTDIPLAPVRKDEPGVDQKAAVVPRLFDPIANPMKGLSEMPGAMASRPIASPTDRSPRAAADYLAALHARDQAHIRRAFGSTPSIPRDRRVLISTVPSPEAEFLADYIDIPRENILKLNVQSLKRAKTTLPRERLQQETTDFFSCRNVDDGSITLLGHMCFITNRMPQLGRLSGDDIWSLASNSSPAHLNFFSCNSAEIATEVCQHFCSHGRTAPQMAFFISEVSPYPPKMRKNKPIRFFYAGPELGAGTKTLSADVHSAISDTLRVMPASATPWSYASRGDTD